MTPFVRGVCCLLLLLCCCLPTLYSWSPLPAIQNSRRRSFALSTSSSNNDNNAIDTALRRLSIAGASVSPTGFWMILLLEKDQYWPVQVTTSEEDVAAATSIESLTLLQLLANVDMATPILPPELLSQLVLLHAEQHCEDDDTESHVMKSLLQELKLPDDIPYSELNDWQKSKVRLPQVTLDGVIVSIQKDSETTSWTLQCASPTAGKFEFDPKLSENAQDNAICLAFYAIALSLRYQASLLLQQQDDDNVTTLLYSLEDIQDKFPLYKSVAQLQQPAHRVQSNLQRGFEIHKLTGALKVAMKQGDAVAAEKIRHELDKYDSMDDLPTSPQFETTDYDSLQ